VQRAVTPTGVKLERGAVPSRLVTRKRRIQTVP
jgi:hypothetical protein